ncbi:AAA family ATPase [Defluviimonas sp. WL0024]|uniref:AAA family ATPase n=1 Tax=Albidovulum salinarum TaxID=2984153 RepID=A0ABT2X8V4_9RHOB|nr:AAA family ATPase [Defluviimonas sp. WL0024]MCU9850379.1 AAA family ATPase [Defluviimonas sp. WL0024]
MTEGLYGSVAPLRNVAALVTLIDRVDRRDHGLPGMACFYGYSGFGKTSAAIYAANRFNAYHVEVRSLWTAKKFLAAILGEIGIKARGSAADLLEQVSEELARTGRTLIVDEADHLVTRGIVELVRDISESSGAPVILIGEEALPQKLQTWERVHGRMLDWVAAQPGDLTDVGHLAKIYCRGVELDEDLQQFLLAQSRHSIRRISINLTRVKEFAVTRGLKRVARGDWGKADFFSGEAPAPRRKLSVVAEAAGRKIA